MMFGEEKKIVASFKSIVALAFLLIVLFVILVPLASAERAASAERGKWDHERKWFHVDHVVVAGGVTVDLYHSRKDEEDSTVVIKAVYTNHPLWKEQYSTIKIFCGKGEWQMLSSFVHLKDHTFESDNVVHAREKIDATSAFSKIAFVYRAVCSR